MTSTVAESVLSTTPVDQSVDTAAAVDRDDDVLADLLVEEISIDGMCGVY